MLALQIGDEYLELPPGLTLELVEANPFLQFAEDEVMGNYSLPFDINAVPPNLKLTDYAALIQKIIDNNGKEVRLYSKGLQHSTGTIKTEKVNHNLNKVQASKQSHYYLFGSSSFYQQTKGKKLREIDMGGDRSFAWDSYASTGTGFWGHITTIARSAPNTDDFAIFPVINRGWPSGIIADELQLMNSCDFHDGDIRIFPYEVAPGFLLDLTRVVPFPYLHKVLRKAVEFAGWTIQGDLLNDTDFLKITMLNGQAIDWAYNKKSGGAWGPVPRDPVVFNLQDNLPDITIVELLVEIRKRLGLWYDFNFNTKTITVSKLVDLTTGEPKDMTQYSSPLITKKIDQEKKIYALRNTFMNGDTGGNPDMTNVAFQGNLNTIADLPAAAESYYAFVYLVVSENNYYICLQNEDTEAWEWTIFSANIFDHAPDGSTDDITTAATTVGMERYNDYIDIAPRFDIQGKWFGQTENAGEEDWGISLVFYHGPSPNLAGHNYPYASSHIYDSSMNQVAQWSLAFDCYKTDGTNVGLYALNWKKFLEILSAPEQFEATLNLPLHLAMQLKFSDQIIIAGVKMFIKEKKSSLEYAGFVDIEAVRMM